MNEKQERMYRSVAEDPGCKRRYVDCGDHSDHLHTMVTGWHFGNITPVPRMICERKVDGVTRYWAILGPFIPEWRREIRAAEVEKQRVESLVRSWTG